MNNDDIKALEECIASKWHVMSQPEFYEDAGAEEPQCALCKLDNERLSRGRLVCGDCDYCIIKQHTGKGACVKTPYMKWQELFDEDWNVPKDVDALVQAAKAELEFLLKFLPAGHEVNTESGVSYQGTGEFYTEDK